MFYHLEGMVTEIGSNLAVIDCCGVGFGVNTTVNTLSYIHSGEKIKLYISEAVKEDGFDLFGFYSKSEKRCFDLLVSVSGIGPKAALSILSANTPDALAFAISTGNEKALTVAPGIGKKIAQRVILELKDKVVSESDSGGYSQPQGVSNAAADKNVAEAVAALSVLGYSNSEISAAIKGAQAGMTAEQLIKFALRQIIR